MRTLKIALATACAVVVGCGFTASAGTTIPASAYVQDGLVAQFDGIENAGAGTHDANATVWKDLKGTHDIPLISGDSFGDDSIKIVKGTRTTETALLDDYAQITIEFNARPTAMDAAGNWNAPIASIPYVGSFGWDARAGAITVMRPQSATSTAYNYRTYNSGYTKLADLVSAGVYQTYTAIPTYGKQGSADDSVYVNAEKVAKTTGMDWDGGTRAQSLLMTVGSAKTASDVRSLRVYGRALTKDEVAWNAKIDTLRFGASYANYRWNADKQCVEYQVSVQGTGGATVSLDGETFAASVATEWAELGTPVNVTVTARVPEGCSVSDWDGVPKGVAAVREGNSITLTLSEAVTLKPVVHTCTTLYWRGGTDALASKSANWADADGNAAAAAPRNGDAIVIDAQSTNQEMTWDLNEVAPASWSQSGWTGTVTFMTGTEGVKVNGSDMAVYGNATADGSRELYVDGDINLQDGTWTVAANPANMTAAKTVPAKAATDGTGVYRLLVTASGGIVIGERAVVSVDGKGFYKCEGPGLGGSAAACAACHGGTGDEGVEACAKCYGSVYRPVTLGTGGYYSGSTGLGGGAVRLEAKDILAVHGTVSARAPLKETYSAAGGSVLLIGSAIVGSGVVDAAGADNTFQGGGGGRIALVQTQSNSFEDWTGTATAFGGVNGATLSGHGTVYYEPADRPFAGDLVLRGPGKQLWPTSTTFGYSYARDATSTRRWCGAILTGACGETNLHFGTISVFDYGHLGIGAGVTVSCDELVCRENGKDIVTLYGGTLRFTRAAEIAGGTLRCYKAGSRIDFEDGAEDKTLTLTGVEFVADAACSIGGNLVIGENATVDHTRVNDLSTVFGISMDVEGSMTVDETGKVSAQASGYNTAAAPGYPSANGYGGCHGGLSNGANGEFCYGSIRKPTTYGSGSHAGATNPGGGVIRLKVAESLEVNGVVTAKGGNNYSSYWHAGAGGSVWISAKTLSGDGSIDADGGYCTNFDVGQGGGGRVAVWLTGAGADFSDFDTAKITANGARKSNNTNNPVTSGCGTVYLKKGDEQENEGTLVISNPGATTLGADKMSARIGPAVTDTDVGRVVIRDNGALTIAAGCSLSVRDGWTNSVGERFVADASTDPEVANAAVVFRDAAVEARVSGENGFCNLTCTAPGKTIRFGTTADGTMTTVAGMLTVVGSEEVPIALKSFTDGVAWPLAVLGGAAISDAVVWDSDARSGNAISATASTGLRCENWTFSSRIVPGETITWTGADATDPTAWTQIGNWDRGRVPVETDSVMIPDGCGSYPKLSDNTTFNSLTVVNGASLNLNSYSLTVTNALNVAGTVLSSGGETMNFSGPSGSFLGGAISGSPFALTLSGPLAQALNPGGLTFKTVTIDKAAGSVIFGDGFAADSLRGEFAAPMSVKFAGGKVVTLKELRLDGAMGGSAANLTLACASSGSTWKLHVSSYSLVTGTKVSGSDASGALKIYDLAPGEDLGGNVNWNFGGVRAVWTGGVQDNCYTNALNWTPNRVPDETSAMVVSGNATVKMPAGETCRALSLLVTGTGNTISGAADSHFEIADTLTLDGGSLQLDVAMSVANGGVLRNGSTVTHKANGASDLYGIDLAIGGDLQIDATSMITAQGRGYQSGSAYPGSARLVSGSPDQAIAHGGRPRRYADICACYGSALHPRTIAGSTANYAKGGGKIRLQVAGALMVDGAVQANGADGNWMSAPGGSVWVTAGTLAGKGTISANAGTPGSEPWGGGGRVAVYLTQTSDFAAFGGVISAYGSKTTVEFAKRRSSAGTVFLKGKDDNGFLIVDNDDAVPEEGDAFFTDFVVPEERGGDPIEDYRGVTVILRNWGTLNLLQDVKIADLLVEKGSAKFVLNDHVLKVASRDHRNGVGWRGETNKKLAKAYVDSICDRGAEGCGRIEWPLAGMMLLVR